MEGYDGIGYCLPECLHHSIGGVTAIRMPPMNAVNIIQEDEDYDDIVHCAFLHQSQALRHSYDYSDY